MQTIQSNLVPLQLSFDSQGTWQDLVCMSQYNVPIDLPTNVVETFCGIAVGLGTMAFNPSGTAVCEVNPTAGSQVTFQQLLTTMSNSTEIWFRVRYPGTGSTAGAVIFLKGTCYVTALDLQLQINQVIQFTFTFTGTGTLDVANP
jgi:hypothetical protein